MHCTLYTPPTQSSCYDLCGLWKFLICESLVFIVVEYNQKDLLSIILRKSKRKQRLKFCEFKQSSRLTHASTTKSVK